MRQEDQLQISEFIKDPASLKLLILAGTKIRPTEISTINKCVSLIKLDLSANNLTDIPLKFTHFAALRILYLHDNQLTSVDIYATPIEYLTLFGNPIKDYRSSLIAKNPKLMAIDTNVITPTERSTLQKPKMHSGLKWPIVQISQDLQHEQDYLNLLKAELFVITQVYKRATYMDTVNRYLLAVKESLNFDRLRKSYTNQAFFRVESVRRAGNQWMNYTQQRQKLKRILAGTGCQEFLLNRMERARKNRSPGVAQVLDRFLGYIRGRMKARKVLQRAFKDYRLQLPVFARLEEMLESQPLVLYFKQSEMDLVDKLFLYARKLFFSRKQYDLCDSFPKLVVPTKKTYYILRSRPPPQKGRSMLSEIIRMGMGLVISQKFIDRRHLLYNKKGHKKIQIKRVPTKPTHLDWQRVTQAEAKIHRLYQSYDTLLGLQFKDQKIYSTVLHLIRYYNSGNSTKIAQNRAAYFQTEIILHDQTEPIQPKIQFSCWGLMRRVVAANIIQKAWRRYRSVKSSSDLIVTIRESRAKKLLGRWFRDLTFRHRMQLSKTHSVWRWGMKETEVYMQLQIYMCLPDATNFLKYRVTGEEDLYKILHTRSECEIVHAWGRKWIRIRFLDAEEAMKAQKKLSILTYRYYFNGFYLKLFTHNDISSTKQIQLYELRVKQLFGIIVQQQNPHNDRIRKIEIDNAQSFFIWPFVEEGFATMFKPEQIQSLPISVFIYNKNRRPLKVNCDLLWTVPTSLYFFRKHKQPQLRIKTPKKQIAVEHTMDLYKMPHMRHRANRQRQFSMKQHKSLLQANRQRGHSQLIQLSLLSETLNIKRQ